MTDITPAQIIATAPLGALIAFSNGETRPPERFRKKLSAWTDRNGIGTLVEVQPDRSSFTLHMGDLGGGGVILVRMYRTYDLASPLTFKLERAAVEGSVLCASVWRGQRKIDKVTTEAGGLLWLENNKYGELLRVGADGALTVIHEAREAA